MSITVKVQKGDTLNSIAQKYGFANYKDAGVSSVPSGNFDLIRPDEEITLANYDPNNIKTISNTPPVVSSTSVNQEFQDGSDRVDSILNGDVNRDNSGSMNTADDNTQNKDKTDATKTMYATGETGADGKVQTTGDPMLDSYNKYIADQTQKLDTQAAERKAERQTLYTTSLAAIDSTAQATIDNINSTYDRLETQQKRINKLNIDRVKAYGLSEGGRFTPLMFSDSISEREYEAADKLAELDNKRNAAIAEAKAARDNGESLLLKDKLDSIDSIDKDIRSQLETIRTNAETQYKAIRDAAKAEEEKQKAAVAEMVTKLEQLAPSLLSEYDNSENKDDFIKQVMDQTGLDYGQVYSIFRTAQMSQEDRSLDIKSKEAKIAADEALKAQRDAAALKSLKDLSEEDSNDMEGDLPETFKDEADFIAQRREFIKKYGTQGKSYWDAVYPYDAEVDDFTYDTENLSSGSTFSGFNVIQQIHDMTAKNVATNTAKNAAIGDIITLNGKQYKKIGEDDYEPVE